MGLSGLGYVIRDAFRSMARHKGMAFASVTTIAISLFILGVTLLLVLNTQFLVSQMETQVEINVFLHEEIDKDSASSLEDKFMKIEGVKTVEFMPKEEALVMMQDRFKNEADLVKALGGNNPFPDTYRLKAESSTKVPLIVSEVELFAEVETVRYGKDFVDKLISFTNLVKNVGLAVIVGMLVAGLYLIMTTTRLTVFTRKKEINIMKFVGATNWFIRFPFFLEGMLIGFLGASISGFIIYFGYGALVDYFRLTVPFIPLITDSQVIYRIFGLLLTSGTILGALGSIIAVHKYLKV